MPVIPPRPAPRGAGAAQRGARAKAWAWQAAVVVLVAAVVAALALLTLHNMRLRGIQGGFGFLADPAGFEIGEGWLPFDASQPYWRAFLSGLANTLRAAVAGIVLCTLLGVALGLGRVGRNALLRGVCRAVTEAVRNVPLLLQLLTWYLALTELLPGVDTPWSFAGWLFLSKAGLAWGAQDGPALTPEYLAVVLGLALYTSAYVAEIVRAGIAAVPAGQLEAAASLGLARRQVMRRVVLPQALRLILPPLASQYLNLTKNSSLAVAVGYPELVSIANTSLNQSGRAVECIAIVMAVYLLLSLLTAWVMRVVERRTGRWWAGA